MKYDLNINGTIGHYDVSQQWVAAQLAQVLQGKGEAGGDKRIDVRISSLGGALSHALDIRQQLRDCEAEVVAHIFSLTASAATVIATGATKTLISKHALYLVHRVNLSVDVWKQLNAGELAEQIAQLEAAKGDLERMDLTLLGIYAEKTGRSLEELRPILEEGRWLTAEEAVALGFADGYVEEAHEEDEGTTAIAIDTYTNLVSPQSAQGAQGAQSDLSARVVELEAENQALREALAKQPGDAPDANPDATADAHSDYIGRAHAMAKAWL